MRDCLLTKCVVAYFAIVSLSLSSEVPKSDDESFDIEPPLLVKPWDPQPAPDDSDEDAIPLDAAKLAQRLEGAKKSAAATPRLVKSGVLSKVEAEQRALRVVRLESELAKAQVISAQQQLTSLKAFFGRPGESTRSRRGDHGSYPGERRRSDRGNEISQSATRCRRAKPSSATATP
jgi:hypothetical protein